MFLAKSVFYGPVGQDVEIEPVSGYCPSNWAGEGAGSTVFWDRFEDSAPLADMQNRRRTDCEQSVEFESFVLAVVCHAIQAENASTELSCLHNMSAHVNLRSVPVLPHLLSRSEDDHLLV